MVRRRTRIKGAVSRGFKEFWSAQKTRVVDAYLSGQGIRAYVANQAPALQVRAAMDGEDDRLKKHVAGLYDNTLGNEYAALAGLFGIDAADKFQQGSWKRAAMQKHLLDQVVGINETTRVKLEAVVQEGVSLGLGPTDIARGRADLGFAGIEGTFDAFSRSRAQLVARTESMYMQEAGNGAAMADMGVTSCDVIGCEDNEVMPGEQYGCNSRGVPISAIGYIKFHPNHRGASVPGMWGTPAAA